MSDVDDLLDRIDQDEVIYQQIAAKHPFALKVLSESWSILEPFLGAAITAGISMIPIIGPALAPVAASGAIAFLGKLVKTKAGG